MIISQTLLYYYSTSLTCFFLHICEVFLKLKTSSEKNTYFKDIQTALKLESHANYTNIVDLFWLSRVNCHVYYSSTIFSYICLLQVHNNCHRCGWRLPFLRGALSDQVSLAIPAGPHPARMRSLVYTFSYIAAVCGLLASTTPLLRILRRGCFFFFYCFSPVCCKAGGRGLLCISHAPCRKLPRGRHNILLWRPGPSLNSPTPTFTPLRCLHHLISSPTSPSQFELIVLHNTPIHWWL